MLEIQKVSKSYTTGSFTQKALKNVSIRFRKNEFVSVLGPSGSGKTTLLNILGGLDRYDSGDLIINNKSTKKFKARDWDAYRNSCVGFIFQSYNLIPHLNILENVMMCMTLTGVKRSIKIRKAKNALKKVGLQDHIHKKPNQLSGGQMQRVAIARALVNDPDIILADEPTGALDSKTSVQIMNLIQEIAKDKLVIMVTHNAELAEEYSTRIIEMKDGEVIHDSHPVGNDENTDEEVHIKKTSMNFLTALNLSLKNIFTKKGRTLLTAFASSIGIIGIALILSLSNGFDKQIDQFEETTLSSLPVVISTQTMNLDEDAMSELYEENTNKEDDYPDFTYVIPQSNMEDVMMRKNKITQDFIDYVEKADPSLVSGVSYSRFTNLNLLSKKDGKVNIVDAKSISLGSIPKKLSSEQSSVIDDKYDILVGREAKEFDELVLIVDSKNRVTKDILDILGLDSTQEKIHFDDVLNSEVHLVLNDDFYTKVGNFFTYNSDIESLYNKKSIPLKVVGIIRLKEDFPSFAQSAGLGYTENLMNYVIEKNKDSKIVKAQEKSSYNVLTGQTIDTKTEEGKETLDQLLGYLGASSTPYMVYVYPKDFSSKDKLLSYLDEYNIGKSEDDKILYTDQAELISSLSSNIMDAITIVLVAFSAISLIVSSIMIGIITYISVLERTKEIGILRSLGARKKDISRVFNAETFIIGVTSGVLGILITRLLLFPVNRILLNLTDLKNVAILNPWHAFILIIISVSLTLIGGWIPAKVASKKDPVIALRTE